MYDWLVDALPESSQLVTASRRLARLLRGEFATQQIAAGNSAWRSPSISSWHDWLAETIASTNEPHSLPTRISNHQSRLLWERCLHREIKDPLLNIGMLARQSMESWNRLQEWCVPLERCVEFALGEDKRLFAKVATNYRSILKQENWIDEAGLAQRAITLIRDGCVSVPRRITLAGFDRIVPQVEELLKALEHAGCRVEHAVYSERACDGAIVAYENGDAELRAAGAWARQQFEQSAQQRVGVVVSGLEQDAPRCARLIKEGLVPGWQNASGDYSNAVNVSYGRKLSSYPAVSIALLALRWLSGELSSRDISLLLRTPILGSGNTAGRIRMELRLRQLPDRAWSPQMLLAELGGREESADAIEWNQCINSLAAHRAELPQRAAPSSWAMLFDDVLRQIKWPGEAALDSIEFQLVNRWRELLNELARLERVSPSMTLAETLGRLSSMANETVFQPEVQGAKLELLGPLEAAGMQFDKLWIAGLSAMNWPPAGRALALVSRELQREVGMPDADPLDTLAYARRVMARLIDSASALVCSYPRTDGDAEQTLSTLLSDLGLTEGAAFEDPGWHASQLRSLTTPIAAASDPVPAVTDDEVVSGGATTIQRQFHEPFASFVQGRLGVRRLPRITAGLEASIRGSLIHDGLHRLYADLPASHDIAAWSAAEIAERLETTLNATFWPYRRHADAVLEQLLILEQQRVSSLLKNVVAIDAARGPFKIRSVEGCMDAQISGIQLRLRYDRIDSDEQQRSQILDYKTGAPKRLLDRNNEPRDMQLVVYACALNDIVADIGLFNIDSRAISIDGAGLSFSPDLDWAEALPKWKRQVRLAAAEIAAGDVRINGQQTTQMARSLHLLSRYSELHSDP